MADVDRAQLLLVTGLLLAVAMVALTLLVNTAIYTENLASRGTDAGGRDAIEFQASAVDAVGGLVDAENERDHASQGHVDDNVSVGVDEIDRVLSNRYAGRGTGVSVENATTHDGTLLRQTDAGDFTNQSTATAWMLAADVPETRGFRIEVVDAGPLNDTSSPAADDAFTVTLNDSEGDTWRLFVYDDSGTTIAVENATGGVTEDVCSPTATPTIDLTLGEVDGSPCPAIVFGNGLNSDYDIEYGHGDSINGTYELTINGSARSDNFNDGPGGQPYEVPAVYSVTADVHFERPDLIYHDQVRVAPGEAP